MSKSPKKDISKSLKGHSVDDLWWKVDYFKKETDKFRKELIELKEKQKILIKIMKIDNQMIKDLKWNYDTLRSEYGDLQKAIPKWRKFTKKRVIKKYIENKRKQEKELRDLRHSSTVKSGMSNKRVIKKHHQPTPSRDPYVIIDDYADLVSNLGQYLTAKQNTYFTEWRNNQFNLTTTAKKLGIEPSSLEKTLNRAIKTLNTEINTIEKEKMSNKEKIIYNSLTDAIKRLTESINS